MPSVYIKAYHKTIKKLFGVTLPGKILLAGLYKVIGRHTIASWYSKMGGFCGRHF